MKKIVTFLSILLIPSILFAADKFPFVAEVISSKVMIRAGQSVSFEKLGELTKGDQIVVVDRSFSWLKIELPSTAESYINMNFIQREADGSGVVVGDRVNVRAGPGVNFTAVRQLVRGDRIEILDQVKDWYKIKPTSQSYGWVAEQFLKFITNDVSQVKREVPQKVSSALIDAKVVVPAKAMPENVTGTIQSSDYVAIFPDIHYKIVDDHGQSFYLRVPDSIVKSFFGQKVKIRGIKIEEKGVSILTVDRVELIL